MVDGAYAHGIEFLRSANERGSVLEMSFKVSREARGRVELKHDPNAAAPPVRRRHSKLGPQGGPIEARIPAQGIAPLRHSTLNISIEKNRRRSGVQPRFGVEPPFVHYARRPGAPLVGG